MREESDNDEGGERKVTAGAGRDARRLGYGGEAFPSPSASGLATRKTHVLNHFIGGGEVSPPLPPNNLPLSVPPPPSLPPRSHRRQLRRPRRWRSARAPPPRTPPGTPGPRSPSTTDPDPSRFRVASESLPSRFRVASEALVRTDPSGSGPKALLIQEEAPGLEPLRVPHCDPAALSLSHRHRPRAAQERHRPRAAQERRRPCWRLSRCAGAAWPLQRGSRCSKRLPLQRGGP